MLIVAKERKRTRPTPTSVPPPPIPAFLPPPPTPPREGRGEGVVYILSYYMQLTQPHMLRVPPILESLG
jgi:hypothetical protein